MYYSLTKSPSVHWEELCEALLSFEDLPLSSDARKKAIGNTTQFVVSQLAKLSLDLRILIMVGIFAFECAIFLQKGKAFALLSKTDRYSAIDYWSKVNCIPIGKLLRAIRSLAVLHFFEQSDVQLALDKLHLQQTSHIPAAQHID